MIMPSPAVQHVIDPPGIAAPAARYAHAVLVERSSRWLHTSGVVPTAPDGSVPSGVSDQADQVWRNIAAILGEAGMGPQHIVSVTTYLVASAMAPGLAQAMAARDAFLGGRRAASTLVTVPALARPEWLLEIAVVAAD
jgi:2-iminobutanoate/2-iminopropanoate deaminase